MLLLHSSAPQSDLRSSRLFRRCKSVCQRLLSCCMRKSPQIETFVATVSYGTHTFWVEGCSLIYDGYPHIPLTHSFHMLCFFLQRLASTLTSPDPDATVRLSFQWYRRRGLAYFLITGFHATSLCAFFCPVAVFMCNFIGVGGSSVIYIFSRLPCACYSYVFNDKEKNTHRFDQ